MTTELIPSPSCVRALPGEGTWAITSRLLGVDWPDPRFDPAFQILGAANGYPKAVYPGQYLDVPPEFIALIPPDVPPPPANVLSTYADRWNERCQVVLDIEQLRRLALAHDPTEVAGRRAVIQGQIDARRAQIESTCVKLAALGDARFDPDAFDLDERFDPDAPALELDGPQSLAPGDVLVNPVFNNVVQHQGDERSEPVYYLNARHAGLPSNFSANDGTLFKLYGNDAPTIMLRGHIQPAIPTWQINGMRGHHIFAVNVTVRDCVDGFWPMDTRTGARVLDDILIGWDIADLAFFAPTPGRPEGNHSDPIQHHGSRGFTLLDSRMSANKNPNIGQGGIVDEELSWHRTGNSCYMLSAPKSGDPVGDVLFAFNYWESGVSAINLATQRPMEPPITWIGDTFAGDTELDADFIIPDNLNDGRVQLWGVSDPAGGPVRIRNWS